MDLLAQWQTKLMDLVNFWLYLTDILLNSLYKLHAVTD